jgi:hypothetical protein
VFGGCWPSGHVYAPGAGEVTDMYGTTLSGFVHLDLKTKKFTFIGKIKEPGCKDGIGEAVRIAGTYGGEQIPTMDVVTGRLFFAQPNGQARNLRSVEKLLPYKDKAGGKEYLLPAFLDAGDLYKKVKGPAGGELEPVLKDGKRAAPTFAVRTLDKVGQVREPGPTRGKRSLLTPDGRGIYVSDGWTGRFDTLKLCDLETGQRKPVALTGAHVRLPEKYPQDEPGSHGGTCVGIDGIIYACYHGGCGRYPMLLVQVNPETGRSVELYSSLWGKWDRDIANKCWDGPADAQYLLATSTLHLVQCPRTGALLNGGWDGAGLRRYHDGFVTSVLASASQRDAPIGVRPGGDWDLKKGAPQVGAHNVEVGLAPNGDMYVPDAHWGGAKHGAGQPLRILRYYRTDWPKEQPEYGYGEKFMPKARLEELMLEYARTYIANYEANSKF